MAARAEVVVTGIAEIREKLDPERLREVLQAAIAEGLTPVVEGARALAPVRTGKLAGSIRGQVGDRRGSAFSATVFAGVGYAHLVEYGHRQVIGGRIARQGRFTPLSARARLKGTVVGQVAPHPFAVPAFEDNADRMAAIIEDRLAAAIEG